MVRTRSNGGSFPDQPDSKYDMKKLHTDLHNNDEFESIISTRHQKRLLESDISESKIPNGRSDDDLVRTKGTFSKLPRNKGPINPSSFERNHRYQQSLRHSSVDNSVVLQRTRERSSHSRSLRSLGLEEEVSSCEEDDGIGALATSCRPRSTSRETFPNMLLRRSNRQAKTMYSTLNASTLEHAVMLGGELEDEPPRTRKKSHSIKPELRDLLLAQGKDPDDIEALSHPDIYNSIKSRKRQRRRTRFFDEMVEEANSDDNSDNGPEDEDEDEDEEEEQKEEDHDENAPEEHDDEQGTGRKYSLRTKRAQPLRLVYEFQRQTRQPRGLFDHLASSPAHRRRNKLREANPASPYQRRQRRTNSQGASSTSSSDSDSDERKFQNRKKKSMTKARNRCLPMNLTSSELATHGFAKERRKIGSSLADVDPMNVDKTIKFNAIGGHRKHIRALKEMIVFPLLYPEVFQKFYINPPRGCLFYGPPGNGKTLMARALANECSSDGRKVAFFMRKGADCLSKWVGESERQLRLLFDQAYQMRPSIIFFDEIDGLAPVRSSRQDQIHSSIVSTLLGLMDGLDNRGEIIVIGATNRIDSIDPALRRPGRFDREFAFPPPDKDTRREIFQIHTQKWSPPLSSTFLDDLAEKTTGYCGADIMTLCAESALFALRRRYPQIYSSGEKLQLDINTISIQATDFYKAMKKIVPSSQRSNASPRRVLNPVIRPLLIRTLNDVMKRLAEIFPVIQKKSKILKTNLSTLSNHSHSSDDSDYDDDTGRTSLPLPVNGLSIPDTHLYDLSSHTYRESAVCRPRLLISGRVGDGHVTHLAPAILHDLEGVPVHVLDLPSLHGYDVRSPEEACAQVFREARRTAPSIIYIPSARRWWELAPSTVRHTFQFLTETLPVGSKVLILAASYDQDDVSDDHFDDDDISKFFVGERGELFSVKQFFPSTQERLIFFAPVFLHLAKKPPVDHRRKQNELLEVLPKAPPPQMAKLTSKELEKIELAEESTMRSLRLFLRDVLTRLAQDRRFKVFLKPVDTEEVPDYAEVIAQPMDISTMMNKIDQHQYRNVAQFATDINLICSNALEYNPDRSAEDRAIRHRACLMKDIAHAIIEDDLDLDFEKLCNEIIEARRKRKADPLKFAPKYYKVLPEPVLSLTENSEAASIDLSSAKKPAPRKPASTPSKKRRKRSGWAMGLIKKPRLYRKSKAKVEEETSSQNETVVDSDHESEVKVDTVPEVIEIDGLDESGKTDDVGADVTMQNGSDDMPTDASIDSVPEESVHDESTNTQSDLFEPEVETSDVITVPHSQTNGIDCNEIAESADQEHGPDDAGDAPSPSSENKESPADDFVVKSTLESNPADVLDAEQTVIPGDASSASPASEEKHDADLSVTSSVAADPVIGEPLSPRMTLRSHSRPSKESDSTSNDVILPPLPPLVVDEEKLVALLHSTVSKTAHLKVESLEEVYSALVRCVRRHRRNYDKTELTQELENIVDVMSNI